MWTTIDYPDNVVFNPRFQRGLEGWETAGGTLPKVARDEDRVSIHLDSSKCIAQMIKMVHYWHKSDLVVRIVGRSLDNALAEISVRFGSIDIGMLLFYGEDEVKTMQVPQNDVLTHHQNFGDNVRITVSVSSGKIEVYEVFLYAYMQTKGILNSDRTRGKHCNAIERLNARLSAGNGSGEIVASDRKL